MSEHKNQHDVPIFYQKQFSIDPASKVPFVFRMDMNRKIYEKPVTCKSQCGNDYLYEMHTLEGADPDKQHIIEKKLYNEIIERDYENLIKKLLPELDKRSDGIELSYKDEESVIYAIIFMYARNHIIRKALLNQYGDKVFDSGYLKADIHFLSLLKEPSITSAFLRMFNNGVMKFHRASESCSFIYSDVPVTFRFDDKNSKIPEMVYMPLSSKYGVSITKKKNEIQGNSFKEIRNENDEIVTQLNVLPYLSADKNCYAKDMHTLTQLRRYINKNSFFKT